MVNRHGRILSFYLLRKNWQWLLMVSSTVIFVIGLFEGIELVRRSMGNFHVDGMLLIEMIVLKIPSHIQKLFPFICFFSVTFCLWRLNQKNEIIAMRASGLSVWQILITMLSFYLVWGIFNLFVVNPVASVLSQRYKALDELIFKNQSNSKLSIANSGLWFRESIKNQVTIVHAAKFDLQKNLFYDVTIYHLSDSGLYEGRAFAKSATLKNQKWRLKNVTYWNADHKIQNLKIKFQPTLLSLEKIYHSQMDPESMSFWNIQGFIRLLKKSGLSYHAYEIHWHACIAKVALVLSMVLLACNFCLKPIRYQKVTHMIVAGLFISFLINFADDIIYALGLARKIPILLAVWFPPLITSMLSINFLIHQEDHL
jgi:lipopolysaccharide export system permease protein